MTAMDMGSICGCCGESLSPLYLVEAIAVCLDCKTVYDEGRWHRWDQIRADSIERKRARRT